MAGGLAGTIGPFIKTVGGDPTVGKFNAGDYYVAVSYYQGQVITVGGFWNGVKSIALTTNTACNAAPVNGVNGTMDLRGIHQADINASNPQIVFYTPSRYPKLDIGAQLVVSRHDPVDDVLALLQSPSLATVFSLSAATIGEITGISTLVPGIVNLFRGGPPAPQSTLLSASLTVQLVQPSPQPGIYIWLAASDDKDTELKSIKSQIGSVVQSTELDIDANGVSVNGTPLTMTSYIALRLEVMPTLPLSSYNDEVWVKQYNAAKALILAYPNVAASDRAQAKTKIFTQITTVQTLVADDTVFTLADENSALSELWTLYNGLN